MELFYFQRNCLTNQR